MAPGCPMCGECGVHRTADDCLTALRECRATLVTRINRLLDRAQFSAFWSVAKEAGCR